MIDLVKDICIFLNWAVSIRLVRRQWDIFNVIALLKRLPYLLGIPH